MRTQYFQLHTGVVWYNYMPICIAFGITLLLKWSSTVCYLNELTNAKPETPLGMCDERAAVYMQRVNLSSTVFQRVCRLHKICINSFWQKLLSKTTYKRCKIQSKNINEKLQLQASLKGSTLALWLSWDLNSQLSQLLFTSTEC